MILEKRGRAGRGTILWYRFYRNGTGRGPEVELIETRLFVDKKAINKPIIKQSIPDPIKQSRHYITNIRKLKI